MEDKTLNFNQPFLSVRRRSPIVTSTKKDDKNKTYDSYPFITQPPHYISELKSGPVTHPGTVPFHWEHTPGISKEVTKPTNQNFNRPPIAPGLPPGRYPKGNIVNLPHETSPSKTSKDRKEESETTSESGDSDEAYVDALETLSRTESYFLNCSMSGLSGMDMEPSRSFSTDPKAREFMMDRFLPAAKAMVSETPQYALKRQQSQEVKKIVVQIDKPSLRYGPSFTKRYSHFQEEEEENDEECEHHGNMPSVCGLLPRFCFLNPIPAMSVRTRVRLSSGNKIQPKSSSSGSYTENEWKSDINDIQLVNKIAEAEFRQNNSNLRNENSQSEIHNTSTFPGFGISDGKDFKTFQELLTDQESKREIDSRSCVVEKIVHVDTIHDSREEGNEIMIKRMNQMQAIDSSFEYVNKFESVGEEAKMMLPNTHGFKNVSSIDNSNEKRGMETRRENRDFDLDSPTTEESHQKYSHQFPVPPPLPKSPSDSWLWRTLPKNVAVRSYLGSSTNLQNKFSKASTVL